MIPINEDNLEMIFAFIKANPGCENPIMQETFPMCKEYIKSHRSELIKRGRVMKQRQGVSFRYFTAEYAKEHNIATYLKSATRRKTKAEMNEIPPEESVLRLQLMFNQLYSGLSH